MYILKNALKCISRSKGRNVLIGIIVFVIAISACLGLSIRQAATSTREDTLNSMSVTATISFDRQSMMSDMGRPDEGGFDRDSFKDKMGGMESLSLEEYETYAKAQTVKEFYYSITASLDGTDDFEPVTTETESEEEETTSNNPFGGGMPGGMRGGFGSSGDFTLEGYSSETAMTQFIDGSATITDGAIFAEGGAAYDCIISEELAVYNSLSVGDSITLANPNAEDETYTLNVVGLYSDTSANTDTEFSMFGSAAFDPANKIYMSYNALQKIVDNSKSVATTTTEENTGRERSSALTGSLSTTYTFANTEGYYQFEEDVRDMGLDESYTVTSSDLSAFENSLTPLNTLSTMATTFLIVILIIGAIILVVLNIFNVRERKYEIGVLTAMGMKKGRVALQFLTEIFIVTLIAVMVGAGIGAVSSVPVTNALLENQVEASSTKQNDIEQSFGRGEMPQGGQQPPQMPSGGGGGGMPDFIGNMLGTNSENAYVTEISSAMDITVMLQMLGIAVLLTLVAGSVSMLFVMRYEPLKILANRD